MDSFLSDDILSDVDDEMTCHKIGMEIVVRLHIDILSVWIHYGNFCKFGHIDWDNYIQPADHHP